MLQTTSPFTVAIIAILFKMLSDADVTKYGDGRTSKRPSQLNCDYINTFPSLYTNRNKILL